ncbi:hypothetical protein CMUS01_07087 [Colletotrichum musicola]|uniref:Uncharacterized protein n=1 Tax=Colletotrichum musicola TaxID=2175873 RepID=A0A8H6KJ56_9PEZI|nr:hypothetical protein CMUS01_07087 [Colletotrichum musicola]
MPPSPPSTPPSPRASTEKCIQSAQSWRGQQKRGSERIEYSASHHDSSKQLYAETTAMMNRLGIARCLRLVKHHGVSGATKNKVAAVGISGSSVGCDAVRWAGAPLNLRRVFYIDATCWNTYIALAPDFRFGKNDERRDDSAQHAECSKHHPPWPRSTYLGKTISTPDDNSPCIHIPLGRVGLDWAENDGYSRSSVSSPHHETWLGSRPSSSSTKTTLVDVPHIPAMGHSPRGIHEAPTGFHIVVMPLSPSAKHLEDWTILGAFNLSPDPE